MADEAGVGRQAVVDVLEQHGCFVSDEAHAKVDKLVDFVAESQPVTENALTRMLSVASDAEAAVIDDLAERAGLVWNCRDEDGVSHWTNREEAKVCGRCGKPRPGSESDASPVSATEK